MKEKCYIWKLSDGMELHNYATSKKQARESVIKWENSKFNIDNVKVIG